MTDRILILDLGLFKGYSVVNYRTFVATGLKQCMCINVTAKACTAILMFLKMRKK